LLKEREKEKASGNLEITANNLRKEKRSPEKGDPELTNGRKTSKVFKQGEGRYE